MNSAPIGILDSGMGGLTVYNALTDLLPREDIIYFGDTAHLPYGTKSPEAVKKYSAAIGDYFSSENVKLMIVACNTASVFALEHLQNKMNFPVLGVIEPAVKAAMRKVSEAVGVIGTYGTIQSGLYEEKLRLMKKEVKIYSSACPLFVPLVEEGWVEHPVTYMVSDIYLSDLKGRIDSIILACTHYPLLKKVISSTLGDEIRVIDSAVEVAKSVKNKIRTEGLSQKKMGESRFCVSDAPELFKERSSLFLEKKVKKVSYVRID